MAESESSARGASPSELGSSASLVSNSSWEVLSDHRECSPSHVHEELDGSWYVTARPSSPPLDVPPLPVKHPWRHVPLAVDRCDDREVALRLYKELEGRSFHEAPLSVASSDTLQGFNVNEPVRSAVTPPPEPHPAQKDALKSFQQTEGARLFGIAQYSPQARASLVAMFRSEGNDEATAILLADEVDGVEEQNGLALNQHGVWYRLCEGEAGRDRKMETFVSHYATGKQRWRKKKKQKKVEISPQGEEGWLEPDDSSGSSSSTGRTRVQESGGTEKSAEPVVKAEPMEEDPVEMIDFKPRRVVNRANLRRPPTERVSRPIHSSSNEISAPDATAQMVEDSIADAARDASVAEFLQNFFDIEEVQIRDGQEQVAPAQAVKMQSPDWDHIFGARATEARPFKFA